MLIKNDLKYSNLKEKVKSVKSIKYQFTSNFNLIDKDMNCYDIDKSNICFYDRNGYILKDISYDSNYKIVFKLCYHYNLEENRVIWKQYTRNDLLFKTYRKYNEVENLEEEAMYLQNGKLHCRFVNKYNNNTNKIESICFDEEGIMVFKELFKYDNNGNNNETIFLDYDECYEGKLSSIYNYYGDISEMFLYDANNTLIELKKYKYIYDQYDNWIKRTEYIYENKLLKNLTIINRNIKYY